MRVLFTNILDDEYTVTELEKRYGLGLGVPSNRTSSSPPRSACSRT